MPGIHVVTHVEEDESLYDDCEGRDAHEKDGPHPSPPLEKKVLIPVSI